MPGQVPVPVRAVASAARRGAAAAGWTGAGVGACGHWRARRPAAGLRQGAAHRGRGRPAGAGAVPRRDAEGVDRVGVEPGQSGRERAGDRGGDGRGRAARRPHVVPDGATAGGRRRTVPPGQRDGAEGVGRPHGQPARRTRCVEGHDRADGLAADRDGVDAACGEPGEGRRPAARGQHPPDALPLREQGDGTAAVVRDDDGAGAARHGGGDRRGSRTGRGGRGVDGDDVVGECGRGRAEGGAEADGGGQCRRRGAVRRRGTGTWWSWCFPSCAPGWGGTARVMPAAGSA